MTRGADRVWVADFVSSPQDFRGYFVFDFDDGQHHVDSNGGEYWDLMACYSGKRADSVASAKAQTRLILVFLVGLRPLQLDHQAASLDIFAFRYPALDHEGVEQRKAAA